MTQDPRSKKLAFISLGAMLVLVAGSAWFYKEKALFTDTAYVLFNIINNGQLAIQFNRYGALIAQGVPYLGQMLHMPLKTMLIMYAAWPYLCYSIVAGVLILRYRQYNLAILMALFYVLFVSQSFYWGSEIPQGMAFLFLMMGTALHMGNRNVGLWKIAVPFVFCGVVAMFTHFTIMVAGVYLWVYLLLDKGSWPFTRQRTILLSILLLACIASKFVYSLVIAKGTGDGPFLKNVFTCSIRDIYHMFSTPVVRTFLYRCITVYWVGTIVFLSGMIRLFQRRKYILATWTMLSVLGYMCVVSLTFTEWGETASVFHIESEWLCMSVLLITPFAFDFLRAAKGGYLLLLLPLIFIARFVYIYQAVAPFETHLQMQARALGSMKQKGIRKVAIVWTATFSKPYVADWAAQYETMLSSALDGDSPQYNYCVVREEDTLRIKALKPAAFAMAFTTPAPLQLNRQYFRMDTVQDWKVMTYEELTEK